jgi:hypothetical protein
MLVIELHITGDVDVAVEVVHLVIGMIMIVTYFINLLEKKFNKLLDLIRNNEKDIFNSTAGYKGARIEADTDLFNFKQVCNFLLPHILLHPDTT